MLQVGSGPGEKRLDPAGQKSSDPDPHHWAKAMLKLAFCKHFPLGSLTHTFTHLHTHTYTHTLTPISTLTHKHSKNIRKSDIWQTNTHTNKSRYQLTAFYYKLVQANVFIMKQKSIKLLIGELKDIFLVPFMSSRLAVNLFEMVTQTTLRICEVIQIFLKINLQYAINIDLNRML